MSQTLEEVEGVIKVSVSFKKKTAKVKAKGKTCGLEGQELLLTALKNEGFEGEVLEKK